MASASSSFVGTESPLSEGGVWTALTAYWQHMRKANGAGVDSAVLGNDCAARYTGVTFTADHYSEVTLAAVPTGGQLFFHYCLARMNATAGCYLLSTAADVSTTAMQLYRLNDSGTYTQIGTNIGAPSALAAGNVLRLEVQGTTLTVKLNQGSGLSTLRTATDSTLATGQPGIGGWAQNSGSNVMLFSSWAAADIVASVSDPPFRRTRSYLHSI